MKKNFGKSFIILITFLVLVSVVFSRNNIGSWTIDVSGLSDSYNLEMYFDNGQTYCNLYNMTNGTTYSGQMDIFNPIISSNGTYGFTITFDNRSIILEGFEQSTSFSGSMLINNRRYNMSANGKLFGLPVNNNTTYGSNHQDFYSYTYNRQYDLTGEWGFSAKMTYSTVRDTCHYSVMGGLPEISQSGNNITWYWEGQEMHGTIEGDTFNISGPDLHPNEHHTVYMSGKIRDDNYISGTMEVMDSKNRLLDQYEFFARRR
mgnify:CR=1 FL=1